MKPPLARSQVKQALHAPWTKLRAIKDPQSLLLVSEKGLVDYDLNYLRRATPSSSLGPLKESLLGAKGLIKL